MRRIASWGREPVRSVLKLGLVSCHGIMQIKKIIAALVLLSCAMYAQEFWKYAGSGADAIMYFNTMQAEKAMDRELWDAIQKERQKALERLEKEEAAQDEFSPGLKDRHVEALLNILVESIEPMSIALDGAVKFSGGTGSTPLEDLKDMLDSAKGKDGIEISTIDVQGREAYSISTSISDTGQPIEILVVPLNDNAFEFKAKLNSRSGLQPGMLPQGGASAPLVQGIAGADVSFAAACNTLKLASMLGGGQRAMMLKNWLKSTRSGSLLGRVKGSGLYLTLNLAFQDASVARQLYSAVSPHVKTFAETKRVAYYFSGLELKLDGDVISADCMVDIGKGWNLVRKLDNVPEREAARPDAKADDDAEGAE